MFGKAGIYDEALSSQMKENHCPPDSVTCKELVAACFLEKRTSLIGTMTQRGILPNAVTCTTVIDAHGKTGKESKALACESV